MKRQGLLSATGVLLLGMIVLMTLHEWENPLDEEAREALLRAPLIIADNITATAYDADSGKPRYELVAADLRQYDRDARTELTEPHLTLDQSTNDNLWTIQSRRGEVLENGARIVFLDQVVAESQTNGVTLNTEELQYFNADEQVVAPGDLELRHRDGRTRAGGMTSDLTTGSMQLTKGVASEFTGTTE